ncbi:hypothetical protein jhhlp_007868 [Lomentospora prolificans]|uniref:Zn(2)-C6 fungal-type domain-containing protein n=1 Tax=Lomentospora prolificans TaxID=41688 RepID=A0A2N3N0T3_9PEZI|nr:hypothetical protein jhhlp_007868 [Lomentospora prolificans]
MNSTRERAGLPKVSYPKKRVNVACEVCRSRKTRCDALRPSCSFCSDIGAQCVYRRPEENVRPDEPLPDAPPSSAPPQPRGTDEQDVISRLERIETLLQQATTPRERNGFAHFSYFKEAESQPVPTPPSTHDNLSILRPTHPPKFNIGYDLTGLSRLSGHQCPKDLEPLCTDTFEQQLELELDRSQDVFQGGYVGLGSLDLGASHCWQLQQFFLKDVLPWCPIIDQADCSDIVSGSVESGFNRQDLDACLTLFILAIGSFAKDSHHHADNPSMFPGIRYFRAACQIVDAERLYTNTIRYVQCQILQAFYLMYCLRPILAYEAIQKASMKVILLLQRRSRVAADSIFRQQCLRAYWTCYLIEHELQAYVPWSSQVLECFNEDMELPLSDYDEPGIYWFLAEITLRRIFSRPRNGLGWNQMFVICEPVVAQEIALQFERWHAQLPRTIKFHIDDNPDMRTLMDPHKIFLRAQYYAILATIFWPYVVRMLTVSGPPSQSGEAGSSSRGGSVPGLTAAETERFEGLARRSLEYAVLKLFAVEPLMQKRHLLLLADLTGMYCMTMLLLCAYEVYELRNIQNPSMRDAILIGWRCSKMWQSNAELKLRIDTLERLMRAKGFGPSMVQ